MTVKQWIDSDKRQTHSTSCQAHNPFTAAGSAPAECLCPLRDERLEPKGPSHRSEEVHEGKAGQDIPMLLTDRPSAVTGRGGRGDDGVKGGRFSDVVQGVSWQKEMVGPT